MFDDKKLWRERAGLRVKDLGSYLRYIFNGHLVIVLLFLLGAAGYYYQNWLKGLSAGFPAEMIMALCFGLFLTYSPVYNLLLPADQIFLLPLENKMRSYFYRSGIVSLIFQGYVLLLLLAAFMPMYAMVNGGSFKMFFPFILILLALKAWNIAVAWRIQYFIQVSVHKSDSAVRFVINTTFAFLLFKQAHPLFLLLIALVMAFYYRFFSVRTKKSSLKWDLLISQEEKRMNVFYRIANLFTDVPKLKDTVNRRKWLDFLLRPIVYSHDNAYQYLLSRTFLRSGDYFGLFIRLTIIGGVAMYFLSYGIGEIIFAVLFMYLTGFQLLPLWNHHQMKLWIDLYPVSAKAKAQAFYHLLMLILITQAFIFAILIFLKGEWLMAIIELLTGSGFSYIFIYGYSKKRLKIDAK